MSYAVKPGARLAGRYRILGPHDESAGAFTVPDADGVPAWLAQDEMLSRPVSLRVLAADAPNADAVLRAARHAAAVRDPRFLAVLDAARRDGLAYVVGEWVEAVTLAELLATRPLAAEEARWVAGEVARALAVAHDAGLAHRCLVPESVLRTESGRIKVAGLGVEAALRGLPAEVDDAGRAADLRAAGGVLYAGLTRRWPPRVAYVGAHAGRPLRSGNGAEVTLLSPSPTRLVAAPLVDGVPCSPRQVRAAVPADLDELACRALGGPLRRGVAALGSVGQLADALVQPGGPGKSGTGPLPAVPEDTDGVPLLAVAASPSPATRAAAALVGLFVVVGLGLLAWQVAVATGAPPRRAGTPSATLSQPRATPSPTVHVRGRVVPVVDARDFDPEGNGHENPDLVSRALDRDPETAWTTVEYYNSPLGGVKTGVGLLVDLAEPTELATVTLGLVGHGSDVELRSAAGTRPPTSAAGYRLVDRASGAGSVVTLRAERPLRARYLLVWFTTLPPSGEASYRGGVTGLEVRT